MNRKGFVEFIFVIGVIIIGLILFVVFTGRVIPSVLYSDCWSNQVSGFSRLAPTSSLTGIPNKDVAVSLSSHCLLYAVIGNNKEREDGSNLCLRTCSRLLGEDGFDADNCAEACSKCGDRGIMFLVPTIPGKLESLTDVVAGKKATFDEIKRHIADSAFCISIGKEYNVGRGRDRELDAIALDPSKGNVACLEFVQRSDTEVTVDNQGIININVNAKDPKELYDIACT